MNKNGLELQILYSLQYKVYDILWFGDLHNQIRLRWSGVVIKYCKSAMLHAPHYSNSKHFLIIFYGNEELLNS